MNLNRATIIGNLTRDPETRTIPSGQSVSNFSVATTYTYKDQSGNKVEKPEYHNIVAWGKLAEICQQYLGKGRKVYVEGRLQTRDWEGQDGVKRYRTEIVADNMIMLDRAPAGGATTGAPQTPSRVEGQANSAPPTASPDDEIKVEDIPF